MGVNIEGKWLYQCEDCDFETTNQRKFREHQRVHENDKQSKQRCK